MELTDKLIQSYMDQEVNPPTVSIYIPTHPKSTSQRMNEDRIRFKNALQELEEKDLFGGELADTHQQLSRLVDDNDFWLHQSKSLAILADTKGHQAIQLPYELTTATHSGDHHALSPLFVMQNIGQTYYLLDLDFDGPVLYAGSHYGLEPVEAVDLPGDIDDVIDTEQRRSSSGARGPSGSGSMRFGRGEAADSQANDVSRYLQLLASPLEDYLNDKSDPLFIAGSPKVIAEFKAMLGYQSISDAEIAANYDQHRHAELHASSLDAMTKLVQAKKSEHLERYASLDFDLRADGMTAVEAAAEQGKVDTLLLPIVRITPDGVDSNGQSKPLIELPEDFAAFDRIVRKVAEQSGAIIPVEQDDFADDPSMKAILRY